MHRKGTPLHIIIRIIFISINHHLHQQHDPRHLHCLRNNTHRASQRNTTTHHHNNHHHFNQSSSSSTTRPSTFSLSEKQHSTCTAKKTPLHIIRKIIIISINDHLHQQHDLRHLHCLRNNTHRASQKNNSIHHHKNHHRFKQPSSSSTTRPSTSSLSETQHSPCIAKKHHYTSS